VRETGVRGPASGSGATAAGETEGPSTASVGRQSLGGRGGPARGREFRGGDPKCFYHACDRVRHPHVSEWAFPESVAIEWAAEGPNASDWDGWANEWAGRK
jgi:hypothetical protein